MIFHVKLLPGVVGCPMLILRQYCKTIIYSARGKDRNCQLIIQSCNSCKHAHDEKNEVEENH